MKLLYKKFLIFFLLAIVIIPISIYFIYKVNYSGFIPKINSNIKKNIYIRTDNIDCPVYYINLDRSPERKNFIEQQTKNLDINLNRIAAVDGKKIVSTQGSIDMFNFVNDSNVINNNELACVLSHLKSIITAYNNLDELALICEDDTDFSLVELWTEKLSSIASKAPEDWNIIQLYHNSYDKMNKDVKYHKFNLKENICYGAVAYLINREGMKNIINNMMPNNIVMINDDLCRPIADRLIYIHCGVMYSYHIPLFITNNDLGNMQSLLFSNDTKRTLKHMNQSKNALNLFMLKYKFNADNYKVFSDIYKNNKWDIHSTNSSDDFFSGNGSKVENLSEYINYLQNLILLPNIYTIIDIGCGDWRIHEKINWTGKNYIGIDVVPELIERNNRKYKNNNIKFFLLDFLKEKIPSGDLIICKDVLFHLPNKDIKIFLDNIKGRFKYFLIVTDIDKNKHTNKDIKLGDYRPLDLTKPPWNINCQEILTNVAHENKSAFLCHI